MAKPSDRFVRATAKRLIGRTITDVVMNPFNDGRRGKAFDPRIVLDNGLVLKFHTQETDVGEYGTEIMTYKGEAMTMTREQAIEKFKQLVRQYGIQWQKDVPREAWDQLNEVNKVLTERDRRAALGLGS